MNCKEAHLLIAAINDDSYPASLAAHLESCSDCSELLALDSRLRATLRAQDAVSSPAVLRRIREEIFAIPPQPWFRRFKNNTIMKITLPALAASAVAVAFVAIPHVAQAATPLATFNKMKKAVLAHSKPLTPLEIHVGKVRNGSVSTWVVFDGVLTKLGPNGTFHKEKDGKSVTVQTQVLEGDSPDLSSLPPAEREQVEKAIADAKKQQAAGVTTPSTTYIVNGRPTDAASLKELLRHNGVDFSMDIDLNAADYRSLKFGVDHNHLVLSPKNAVDRRYIITLDPNSNLPQQVLLEENRNGKWADVTQSKVTLL